jgi:hypothetical protein
MDTIKVRVVLLPILITLVGCKPSAPTAADEYRAAVANLESERLKLAKLGLADEQAISDAQRIVFAESIGKDIPPASGPMWVTNVAADDRDTLESFFYKLNDEESAEYKALAARVDALPKSKQYIEQQNRVNNAQERVDAFQTQLNE